MKQHLYAMLAGDSTEFKKEGDVVKVTSRLLGDKDYIVEKNTMAHAIYYSGTKTEKYS